MTESNFPKFRRKLAVRCTWRTVTMAFVSVLMLVVVVGTGAELYLRKKVTDCLAGSFTELAGAPTSVSIPGGPLVFSWIDGKLAWVQVDTDDSVTDAAMRIHARATGVNRDGSSVEHLQGKVYVPYSRIVEIADSETDTVTDNAVSIHSVRGNSAEATITVDSVHGLGFLAIPATVVLKPVVVDGHVDFHVQDVTMLGVGLGSDIGQQMVDRMSEAMLGSLFEEIEVRDLTIGDDGFKFDFSGDNVNMQSAEMGTNASPSARKCS